MKAKKSLGQNFLIDNNIIKKIAEEIPAFSNDLILEIGPGRGALTEPLVKKNAYYLAFEIDKELTNILKKYENARAKIIYEDILNVDINKYLTNFPYDKLYIVGNLPYYITTPIIEKIIASNLNLTSFVIMVQKEVADRFMANTKSKEYGYFTLYLRYFFDIKKVCDVSKKAFFPAPKVNSTVLKLIPRQDKIKVDIKAYQQFLKQCFQYKRKTLKNNLSNFNWPDVVSILNKYHYKENVRAEELEEKVILELFMFLTSKKKTQN